MSSPKGLILPPYQLILLIMDRTIGVNFMMIPVTVGYNLEILAIHFILRILHVYVR